MKMCCREVSKDLLGLDPWLLKLNLLRRARFGYAPIKVAQQAGVDELSIEGLLRLSL